MPIGDVHERAKAKAERAHQTPNRGNSKEPSGSVDGERRKIPIRILERTERTLSLPSVIIYRYFFYRQRASCVQFLCACAKEPRYFPDRGIDRSTDCELTRAARPTPGKIARGATQLRGFDPGPAAGPGPGGGRRAGRGVARATPHRVHRGRRRLAAMLTAPLTVENGNKRWCGCDGPPKKIDFVV